MSRICSFDGSGDALIRLADEHPDAVCVMINLMKEDHSVDPDNKTGNLHKVRLLDEYEIYGKRIWIFYKNLCQRNVVTMMALLRAVELQVITKETLSRAIDDQNFWDDADINLVVNGVVTMLPNFGRRQ